MGTRAMISGTGFYAPDRVIPNSYFDDFYQQDVGSFLRESRNIYERRYAAEGEMTSDMAAAAARRALAASGVAASDIELIIVATDTPDFISPSTAAVVQHKIGAAGAGTFDLNTACAGFVTALDVGRRFVETGYRHVLVVGAYLMSRFLDFRERNVATLFADGAGAVVLSEATAESGILATTLSSEGQYFDYMGIYAGAAGRPASLEVVSAGEHLLQFRSKFPPTFNLEHWTAMIRTLSDESGIAPEEVDRFFFTQINIGSINETLDTLGLPRERSHNIMDRYGYTGSACIPMAMADAASSGKLKRGQNIFLIASGGGAAFAGAALRWGYDT
jgi:3-oxoacyl-[acyl-carrier-protein] synthase III